MAKELSLKVNGVEMDYITFGKGKDILVMIQGLNTNGIKGAAAGLAYMYRLFAKEYTVYLFDRRKELKEDVTVRELAADITLAMDTLGIKNADVFGVSQGGMIAQYLAIDRPDLVHKMVLAVTLSKNNDTVKSVVENWIELTEKADWKGLVEDMTYKMYSDAYVKKYKLFFPLLTVLQKPKDVLRFLTLSKACLTCNAYEELDKIKCPVMVIGGDRDQITTGEASIELAEKLGCEIYMYDNLGHAAYEEAVDFNQRVFSFLRG